MSEFGHFSVCLAWLLALYGVISGAIGGIKRSRRWYVSSANATMLVCATTFLSTVVLGYAFITNDYSLQYVWQFSNRDMDWIYKISAIWGGMDGSMLLWCLFLSVSAAIVAYQSERHSWRLMTWVLAVANTSSLFFLTMVVFLTNPFRYISSSFIPPDGNGLNPLLQNPLMAIHPPTLYVGFTTFAIPYAFCLGALLAGNLNNEWIRLTRRWTLVAWSFLTAGIVLGGHWAYVELGWGGFWAWDPVENASFLPWLTGTAYLHSVMVQERKNMLKVWNVWLVVATYGLTVFGTFLTRSGIVQSVHAFAETDVGWVFLLYLGLLFLGTLFLTYLRRVELRPERKIESWLSREAAFLVNNLLLLSICFATLWGVMFPVLSEAITGVKQTVSIPFFNAVNVPFFLALIFMMGVGPLVAWREAKLKSLLKSFVVPFVFAFGVGMILLWAGVYEFYPLLSYMLCVFVLMSIMGELHRGMRAQRIGLQGDGVVKSSTRLLRRHHVRYGGYLVHFGVLIVTVAITSAMAHKIEREFMLGRGESIEVGRYSITLKDITEGSHPNYSALITPLEIRARGSGSLLGELAPELRSYKVSRENTTEVALRTSLKDDLYLVLIGLDNSGERAALKVFINPLQVWLWFGAIIMLIGSVVVMIPRQRVTSSQAVSSQAEVRV